MVLTIFLVLSFCAMSIVFVSCSGLNRLDSCLSKVSKIIILYFLSLESLLLRSARLWKVWPVNFENTDTLKCSLKCSQNDQHVLKNVADTSTECQINLSQVACCSQTIWSKTEPYYVCYTLLKEYSVPFSMCGICCGMSPSTWDNLPVQGTQYLLKKQNL